MTLRTLEDFGVTQHKALTVLRTRHSLSTISGQTHRDIDTTSNLCWKMSRLTSFKNGQGQRCGG